MANEYGHLQWVLDTAGTISTDKIRVKRMEYVPNAAGDDLAITDNNGEEIWTVTDALTGGRAGLETIYFNPPQDFLGFILAITQGGTLYVYIA
jgi:hypothetical protein